MVKSVTGLKIASVIIDSDTRQVDKIFSYAVPASLEQTVRLGVRVRVPFGGGNRHQVGFVIKTAEGEDQTLKEIVQVLDARPLFDRTRLVEAYWIKNRFFSTFAAAVKLFLPPGSGAKLTEWVRLGENTGSMRNTEKAIADILTENGGVCAFDVLKEKIGEKTRKVINAMQERELVTVSHTVNRQVSGQKIRVLRFWKEPTKKLSDAAMRAVRIMRECECLTTADLCLFASCSSSTVRTLVKKEILAAEEMEIRRTPHIMQEKKTAHAVTLNAEQQHVAAEISKLPQTPLSPMLLRGVTGSGKTEVYLAVIEKIIEEGGSAIVLVPEIALTHQMVGKFLQRFGGLTAVLHSGLSLGERHDEWFRIAEGKARVVVGARSAVFAPCKNLRLIVIDEEHEETYKSESGVRYHARDVAMCRAKTEGAKVLLASATPSVESFYHAEKGTYKLLELTKRFNDASLPETGIVDMREEVRQGNTTPVSRTLLKELTQNVEAGEQSILFLNRRGYATFVSCRECGHVETCPHCSISLTYHSFSGTLNCHYCGYRKKMPSVCPACGSSRLQGFGTGTQKVEEYMEKVLPTASLIRMDVDTTRKKESHEKILTHFQNENIRILLGTQMIAKGLDFPNVTLVGVLSADQMLNMGDYKAAERTFDLITQVSGRAGRGEKRGRTIIQTHTPDSPVIQFAAQHDYLSFYADEIILRKALNYPPFCDIINIIISGHDEEAVKQGAQRLYENAAQYIDQDTTVYRAAPCGINKIKNVFRWHVWLKCRLTKQLCSQIAAWAETERKLMVTVDVNPLSM